MMKKLFFIAVVLISVFVFAQPKKPIKKVTDTPTASIERGQAVYQKECLSCHQSDGGGVPHLNPPLYENTDVVGDKKKIITVVLNGLSDRLPIDSEYYSNSMASHSYLTNQQIADVLTYVRASFGNKASVVTADEVKTVRLKKKK